MGTPRPPDGIRVRRIVSRCDLCHTERRSIPGRGTSTLYCPTCMEITPHSLSGADWHNARRCTLARRQPEQ